MKVINNKGNKHLFYFFSIISTDEDPSLRIESSAMINLRGVSTKLNKYIVFTMQTYKKLIINNCLFSANILLLFIRNSASSARAFSQRES